MQKTFIFLFCFVCAALPSGAQSVTWHKKLAGSPTFPANCQVSVLGDQYFLYSDRSFAQIDRSGTVTGYYNPNISYPFWTSVRKKQSAVTGHPYFLIVRRPLPLSSGDYQLSAHRPRTGTVHETTFADSLGTAGRRQPFILELNDSVSLVFGFQFVRKIKYSEAGGFAEEWSKPLDMPVIAAIKQGDTYVLAGSNGVVRALDADMNTLWSASHPVVFRNLKASAGGFIGCGKSANGTAVLIKLDPGGSELWMKETPDLEYLDLVEDNSGDFIVAGKSNSGKILRAVFDAAGLPGPRHEYVPGTGTAIVRAPDGGYVIAGTGSGGIHLLKTDEAGNVSSAQPDTGITSRTIRTQGVNLTVTPSPALFFNGYDHTFFTPADSATSTFFVFSPVTGGLDESNQLHLAETEFGLNSDYRAGLWNSNSIDFSRVWLAKKEEIDALRRDFATDQTLDQSVPFDLLNWPAKGNPNFKYALDFRPVETDPLLFPAPFVDINGDGIYNVYDGDYPRIKGDQMAWWALTDSTAHPQSSALPIIADLFLSAYAYDCPQNSRVGNALRVDYEVVNRASTTYTDTYMGFFADPELGCGFDDYTGSLPSANSVYAYNADNFDDFCDSGQGYGPNIPVQTVTFLNRSMDHSVPFNNLGPGNNQPLAISYPGQALQFYQYLKGIWLDGTPFTRGGTGYNPGSNDFTDHIYPDNPADLQGWTMCSTSPLGADRYFLASHGPFTFAPGDTFRIETAFLYHPDVPHPCPDIFGLVLPAIEQVQAWHDEGVLDASVDLGQVLHLAIGQSLLLDAGVPNASYLWSNGATTPTINVTEPGEYTVTVSVASSCQIVENVLVKLGAGVQPPPGEPGWTLQPNPAGPEVYIGCADCGPAPLQVVLRSAQGVVLRRLQGQNRSFRMDVQNLPAGFYWTELWQENRLIGCKKLILKGW